VQNLCNLTRINTSRIIQGAFIFIILPVHLSHNLMDLASTRATAPRRTQHLNVKQWPRFLLTRPKVARISSRDSPGQFSGWRLSSAVGVTDSWPWMFGTAPRCDSFGSVEGGDQERANDLQTAEATTQEPVALCYGDVRCSNCRSDIPVVWP